MQNKRIGISPQIRLLIEAIGDTIEDDYDASTDTLSLDLDDINSLLTTEDSNLDEFHDAPTTNNDQSNECNSYYTRSPNKGEPPPITYTMGYQQWCHDVICTITDNNDIIQPPIVRIIFDQHNIPTTNTLSSSLNPSCLYEDEQGLALNKDDIFHNTLHTSDHTSYGHIFDKPNIHKQLKNYDIPQRPTSYICIPKFNSQDTTNITSHISPLITNTTMKGIYQFQFSN